MNSRHNYTLLFCAFNLLLLLLIGIIDFGCLAEKCAWDNCPQWSSAPGALNVHLVAHTHDDMGWIKSADDYYTGARPNLVPVGVQYILNTVIDELAKDPSRRFCYAEAGFLHRWLIDHGLEERAKLRRLITETGQLELIGGGWTQPDEAATHYINLIDQYSLGLGLLNATYGRCGHPRVAWQIDPFGHSREHANLVALMGHQALFFARMHYAELAQRAKGKELEMLWTVSDELKTNILTGGFLRGTYAPPDGFCFDSLCADEPIVDSRAFEGYNVEQKFERFVNFVRAEAATQRHGHVMMTMGGDFQYSNANQWFIQLDKLLRLINARANETGIRAFYSTPGCYLAALNAAQNLHLPTKQSGDFFPYAFPGNHSYWTGYFVSKPALKGLIRESSALLQLGRSFEVLASAMRSGNKEEQGNEKGNNDDVQDNGNANAANGLLKLEQALALCTHHDAVTGTSKENVTRDYTRRLLDAWDSAEALLNTSFWQIALSKSMKQSPSPVPPLQFCRLAHNRSSCPFTQRTANFSVTVFNGLSWAAESLLVRIPLYRQRAKVLDAQGREVPSAVIKTFLGGAEQQLKEVEPAPYQLQFQAQIPPLGFRTFFVITVAGSKRETRADTAVVAEHNGAHQQQNQQQFWHQNLPKLVRMLGAGNRRRLASVSTSAAEGAGTGTLVNFDGTTLLDDNVTTTNETVISNNFFRLTFDANGLLSTVQDRRQGRILRLRQQFHFYRGANNGTGAHPEQPSGAYIFRPNGSHPLDFPGPVQLQVLNTTVAQEVRQVVSPWLSQTIRLVPGRPLIEFEWLIGPLPKNTSAPDSTEVISRYTLLDGLQGGENAGGGAGLFWTDANGRQMMERKRNDSAKFYEGTEPVAANYYPVNSRIWVQDDKLRMTVLTDRSQGGTSLKDGQIELMLHRRCFWDDHFGVEEALDEPGEDGRGLIVHGRHWLLLSPPNSAEHRRLALELLHQSPPQTMGFASMDFVDANVSRYAALFQTEYSAILSALPPNVQLLTLRTLDAKNILLRLEHFYQDSDNFPRPYDADPVEVDIHNLFRPFSVLSAEELALGANKPLINTSAAAAAAPAFVGPVVKLTPMEIRTFRVRISR